MRRTVANRPTPVNLADLQDSALETGDLAHRIGAARLRVDAIERGTRADKIEMKLAAEKDAGGRGEAGRHMAEGASCGSEARPLGFVQRMPWFVCASKMADEGAPTDRALIPELVGESIELSHGQAEAGHSRVEMHHRRQPLSASGDLSPILDLSGLVEDRHEPIFDKILCGAGKCTVQDGDLERPGENAAQRDTLLKRGRKEEPASG